MSDFAVRAEQLSKQYFIGSVQEPYQTLRDTITDALVAPFRRTRNLLRGQAAGAAELHETIWALKNLSFEIKTGEVVGVVGRNGAGKSTLLKILSRITEPTSGYVDVYGRVGALLEVGTGFHPELTGRENIYLNGAILGMTRAEIGRLFDEIVAFAEVERFLDTPVKHYSSGMGLRLGFAVAAHLEPDILVVDEVLAVGDVAFQKKCIGKMDEVAHAGRTVLFVSHNLAAVSNLCSRCIYLSEGQLLEFGPTDEIIRRYLSDTAGSAQAKQHTTSQVPGSPLFIQQAVLHQQLQNEAGRTQPDIRLKCQAQESVAFNVEWHLISSFGVPLAFGSPEHFRQEILTAPVGDFEVQLQIADMPLGVGQYYLNLYLSNYKRRIFYDRFERAVIFTVDLFDPYQTGYNYRPSGNYGNFNFPDQLALISSAIISD